MKYIFSKLIKLWKWELDLYFKYVNWVFKKIGLLILLVSFLFGQVPIGMNSEKDSMEFIVDDDFVRMLNLQYDPEFYETKCFEVALDIDFADEWEDIFDYDSICTEVIDVRIKYEGVIKDYTKEDFLQRLGFKE